MKIYVDTSWTTLDFRDAIIAVHRNGGKWDTSFTDRYNGVSKRHVMDKAKKLPKDVVDDEQRWALTRAANELANAKQCACFTKWELREALVKCMTREMKQAEASAVYGPSLSCLQKWITIAYKTTFGSRDPKLVRDTVDSLDIKSVGRPAYLTEVESIMLVEQCDQAVLNGTPGSDRKHISSKAQELCRTLAEGEPDPKRRERYMNAKCGPSFVKKVLSDRTNAAKVTLPLTLTLTLTLNNPNPNPDP